MVAAPCTRRALVFASTSPCPRTAHHPVCPSLPGGGGGEGGGSLIGKQIGRPLTPASLYQRRSDQPGLGRDAQLHNDVPPGATAITLMDPRPWGTLAHGGPTPLGNPLLN